MTEREFLDQWQSDFGIAERNRFAPECPEHPGTKMVFADGTQPHHDLKYPHYRCELWIGGGVCGKTRALHPKEGR